MRIGPHALLLHLLTLLLCIIHQFPHLLFTLDPPKRRRALHEPIRTPPYHLVLARAEREPEVALRVTLLDLLDRPEDLPGRYEHAVWLGSQEYPESGGEVGEREGGGERVRGV